MGRVGDDNRVGDALDVVAALRFELGVDLGRDQAAQELVYDLVNDASDDDWKYHLRRRRVRSNPSRRVASPRDVLWLSLKPKREPARKLNLKLPKSFSSVFRHCCTCLVILTFKSIFTAKR